jgi:hypothetical protein
MKRFNSEWIEFAATVGRRLLNRGARGKDPLLNDHYVSEAPSDQQTVDLFAGAWASKLPIEGVKSGSVPLFDDERIRWLLDRMGGAAGLSVLELGPLEGGHTTMMERAGAAEICAIDANTLCYLKCLVVKELLGLKAARFELGDFDAHLASCDRRYDLIVASGVLYHLVDPLRTLINMTRLSDRLFIWSHFYDEAAMPESDSRRAWMTGKSKRQSIEGETLTYHYRSYGGTRHPLAFCGGKMSHAVWLEQGEVLELLERRKRRS